MTDEQDPRGDAPDPGVGGRDESSWPTGAVPPPPTAPPQDASPGGEPAPDTVQPAPSGWDAPTQEASPPGWGDAPQQPAEPAWGTQTQPPAPGWGAPTERSSQAGGSTRAGDEPPAWGAQPASGPTGAPEPPPTGPGWGAAPTQPPGWGQSTQQSPGWGQQPGQQGQPTWSQPAQPGWGAPGPPGPPGQPGWGTPPPSGGSKNTLIFLIIAGVVLLLVVVGGVLAILAARDDGQTASDSTSGSGPRESVDAFSLEIGDCILDPLGGEDEGEVFDVEAVDCAQPHDREVYALIDYPAGADANFVGDDEIQEFSGTSCEEQFEDFIGVSYAESEFFLTFLHPTEASWEDGDREVVCLVYDPAGPVTGTLRDANS